MNIPITRTKSGFDDIELPSFASSGAAGMDVRAAISEPISIPQGAVAMIPTGIACAIPEGFEMQVRSRSGLAAKSGIFCLNAPGTIDSDFRGEIHVILANFGQTTYTVQRGERIAQLVVARFERVEWSIVEELPSTERGTGGFGSTGKL
ncbi:MAG: dUTP diphosphatase [Candidatus Kapaibacterium sp.]|nr:MAG: dUTP diphosphatase [Candidatus Kapabacteria bacterium]